MSKATRQNKGMADVSALRMNSYFGERAHRNIQHDTILHRLAIWDL